MEDVKEKAAGVITSALPNAVPKLMNIPASGSVGGFVLWDGFEDLNPKDRQDALWKALREKLSPEEQLELTAIFTLTRDEYQLTLDDDEDG